MVDDQTDRSWDDVPAGDEAPNADQAGRGAAAESSAPMTEAQTAQDPGWAPSSPQPWARPGSGTANWSAPDPAAHVPAAPGMPSGYSYGYPTQGYSQPYSQAYPPPGYGYPQQTQAYPQQGQAYQDQTQAYPQQGQAYPQSQPYAGYSAGGYPQQGFGGGNPPTGGYPYNPYASGYYPPQPYYQPIQPTQPTRSRGRRITAAIAAIAAFLLIATGAFWANGGLQGATEAPRIQQPAGQGGNQPQLPGAGEQGRPGDQQGQDQGSAASTKVTAAQAKGVVLIAGQTSNGTAAGTGMILTADGKVLTNYHVVAGTDTVAVNVPTTGDTYLATVLGFDQTKDVALLQLKDASGLATVTIDKSGVTTGSAVTAVGNAEGGGVLVDAPGKVTGLDRSLRVSSDSPWGNFEDLSGLIQTNAGAVPGHSGGPMFDAQAEVVGITTAGSTKAGTSYAVPIATALSVVSQIETGADAGTVRVGPAGFLGVQPSTEESTGTGIDVVKVVTDSPAAKAGMTAGSTLIKVGDTTVRAGMNLANVIRSLEPGQQVSISWITSSGKTRTATVTLGSSPVN